MIISPIIFRKMMVIPLITIILVLLHGQGMAPEFNESQSGSTPVAVIKSSSIADVFLPLHTASIPVVTISSQVSRGEPAQRIESKMMRVTAYTRSDKGMNGKGITADGEKALAGQTMAADSSNSIWNTDLYSRAWKNIHGYGQGRRYHGRSLGYVHGQPKRCAQVW